MKRSDEIRAFIKGHPDAVLEDVAEMFGVHVVSIAGYAKEAGVKLITRKQANGKDWLTSEDVEYAEKRTAELMKNPKVVRWLKENDFEIG